MALKIFFLQASDINQHFLWSRLAGERRDRHSLPRLSFMAFLGYWVWFRLPNVGCVFSNGAVARKLSGACYVQNRFMCPCAGISIQRAEPFMRLAIRRKVRQVHVVIAITRDRRDKGVKPRRLL